MTGLLLVICLSRFDRFPVPVTHRDPVKPISNIINARSSQIQSMGRRRIPQEETGEKWTHTNKRELISSGFGRYPIILGPFSRGPMTLHFEFD
jgi:hypothetical protein